MVRRDELPVVVIGAGPVGLAAGAHLRERGLEVVILEAGQAAGAAVTDWGHVRLFSPWRYNIDAAARRLLDGTGWVEPDLEENPTGAELVRDYVAPLAATAELAPRIRYGHRVIAVTREGADRTRSLGRERRPYLVRAVTAAGETVDVRARHVLDASGTYGQRNPVGDGGILAPGEADARARGAVVGPLPDVLAADRERFAGRTTLVVGMGHSAANTLLSLVELAEQAEGTRILWAIRGGSARRLFGGGADDELPARGLLGTKLKEATESGRLTLMKWVTITQMAPEGEGTRVRGLAREEAFEVTVHSIVDATGFRPDLDMLREVRLDLDAVVESPSGLAELIDPNQHSCGTVPPHGEPLLRHPDDGFYLVGMKSYGRAPTFLLATGYEQVRSVAAALAGDSEAAGRVSLSLPATGVCSTDLAEEAGQAEADAAGSGGCCGGTPEAPRSEPQPVGFASGVPHGRSLDLLT
ncbi:NAD(P)-binding domain-containing protein [Serinibacter salmoneus]|uniref:Pyridine nucleotide-disulfide oxidoreductase n=1 Tax=Serinibacter salmoneus TaxID=556530 RepID=A0A2A9CXU5_9MICO|nr:NAD(P)-binding domain-containing protein [Serinibacter salmoneus]PFG18835.1 pyridine nucleotide-disulfide oxidoreductase [Serinibacter salmoneus]